MEKLQSQIMELGGDCVDVLETLDNLQNAAEKDSEKKQFQNNKKPEYHFDKLKMYFGEDYEIMVSLFLFQPSEKFWILENRDFINHCLHS